MKATELSKKAKWLHDNYELFAKETGWNTQESTKVEFEDLPKANKDVMLKMAELILSDVEDVYPSPFGEGVYKPDKKIIIDVDDTTKRGVVKEKFIHVRNFTENPINGTNQPYIVKNAEEYLEENYQDLVRNDWMNMTKSEVASIAEKYFKMKVNSVTDNYIKSELSPDVPRNEVLSITLGWFIAKKKLLSETN